MFPATNGQSKIRLVFPLCQRDGALLLANLRWQNELESKKDFTCVLSIESSTSPDLMQACHAEALKGYAGVESFVYPRAPIPKWPNAPNWAFQHAAQHMKHQAQPWFWMEPDCVPTKSCWLTVWNQQYFLRKKPLMGFIIPSMGHCNGTAIYPPNFPALSPKSMTCTNVAWDGLMKQDTIHLTADASDLMCHVWGIRNGRAQICGGEPAVFQTQAEVDAWVNPRAILFHRAKDTTLIARLRERRQTVMVLSQE